MTNKETLKEMHRGSLRIPDLFASMIHDISNTGASVVQIEKNSTCESIAAELPPQSFRITVVGGYRDSIAQCIHDNKPPGIRSFWDTSGVAIDEMIEFAGNRREWFDHIDMDYISRAINFMEKWQPIIYDIREVIEDGY